MLCGIASLALAQSRDEALPREARVAQSHVAATARIIGYLPDGSPPPEVSPKPKLIVGAKDIVETKVHSRGGRELTVRKISPTSLAPPRKPVSLPIDVASPVMQERIHETLEANPNEELIIIGASVFRAKNGTARTFVALWPSGAGGKTEPITFWSSADFGYLSGFCSFQGADGATRNLIMAWSIFEIGEISELNQKWVTEYGLPGAPEFPTGKAAFILASGENAAPLTPAIQDLHDLYQNDYQRLKVASEGREQAARQYEAMLKSNPPQTRSIILNTWPIQTSPKSNK